MVFMFGSHWLNGKTTKNHVHLIPNCMTTTLSAVQALWHCTNINARYDTQCPRGLITYSVQSISNSRCKTVNTMLETIHHVVL